MMGTVLTQDSRGGHNGYNNSYNNQSHQRQAPARVAPPAEPAAADPSGMSQAELASIRARYLGQTGPKKVRAHTVADKKKFVFDWAAGEDTSGVQTLAAPKKVVEVPTDNHADALERRRAGRGNTDERHWSDKPLEEMKDRDWRIFREDFSIAARGELYLVKGTDSGGSIPMPLRSWRESTIPKAVLDVIDEIGYTEPSPIQRQAIPIGMQNRDLVGIAKTGSGKTAAFVIPMLDYIGHMPPFDDDIRHLGPYALIMAPTRELAQQIESETKRFADPLGYKCVSIVGGRSVEEQQFNLRDGAEIIIATPGRLKDMLDKSMIVMSQCRYVVMDEADRMVDLGFEIDLTFILDTMPSGFVKPTNPALLDNSDTWKGQRVTTLFSATMPPAVERLTRKYLRKPAFVTIGTAGEAVDTVEQRIEFVHGEEKKKARLIEILRSSGLPPPMIVFVNQKATADVVVRYVQQAGQSGTTLHSGKTQEQREAALASLRNGEVNVLVATDLAGRGIDVPDVSLVINWQMADTIERYVHRIGRTGRAGKKGIAITFLTNDDDEVMFDLKNEVAKSAMSTMNPELAKHEAAKQRITREMKVRVC
jgi:ATP-dependent RNA helicase DDX23/PRP28